MFSSLRIGLRQLSRHSRVRGDDAFVETSLLLDYDLCRELADHELAILPAREPAVDACRPRPLRVGPDEDESARRNARSGGDVKEGARTLLAERIGERAIGRAQALDRDAAAAQPCGGDARAE